jgi:hypothetical protein
MVPVAPNTITRFEREALLAGVGISFMAYASATRPEKAGKSPSRVVPLASLEHATPSLGVIKLFCPEVF